MNIEWRSFMKMNEGNLDRTLRIVFGIFIFSLLFWGPKSSWAYIGIIPFITGVIGYCPLYSILGFNTCPLREKK
jgi:hypothetical protein